MDIWERPLNRRRLLAATGIGTGATAFAAACRRGGHAPAGGQGSASAQPRAGGTLSPRITNDIATWNVSTERSTTNTKAITHAYNGLLSFKADPSVPYDKYVLQPQLAEKYEIPDPQTYLFHLRKGVTFHNLPPVNGRGFVANDVKWSFEFLSTTGAFKGAGVPPSIYGSDFVGMDRIEMPDDYTVAVHFQEPLAAFVNYVGHERTPILPHEILEQDKNLTNLIVGTGPWQLDAAASQRGAHYVWRKNPNYWQPGKPYIDTLNWILIVDDSTAYSAFQANQVELLSDNVQPRAMQQVKKSRPDAMTQRLDTGTASVFWNVAKPPLNDPRVRQAISLGIDREEIIRAVAGGEGRVGVLSAAPDDFTPEELKGMLKYGPAQAQQLLNAAGFASGSELEMIWCLACYGDQFATVMELMQAQLRKIGVSLSLKPGDSGAVNQRSIAHNFTMRGLVKANEVDMDAYLYSSFGPGDPQNYGQVNDSQLTSLLEAQRREFDAAKRRELWRQAVRRINSDMFWMLSLYILNGYAIWQPRLKNFALNASTNGWPMENSWLAT